jgi:hypothetical protein
MQFHGMPKRSGITAVVPHCTVYFGLTTKTLKKEMMEQPQSLTLFTGNFSAFQKPLWLKHAQRKSSGLQGGPQVTSA